MVTVLGMGLAVFMTLLGIGAAVNYGERQGGFEAVCALLFPVGGIIAAFISGFYS